MNRNIIKIVFLLFLCACSSKEKAEEGVVTKEDAVPAIKDERPVMTFTLTDGAQVNAQGLNEKFVLVLFQPDCDHCQNEAKQIRNRLEAFQTYQLYFISSHPMEVISKFATDYGLAGLPNVHFGWTSVESVLNNYGAISAPSVYIYTKEGRLVESFEGQVDVEMIIRHL